MTEFLDGSMKSRGRFISVFNDKGITIPFSHGTVYLREEKIGKACRDF